MRTVINKKSLFHERLRQLKKESGKTQAQIANNLGIKQQTVCCYMNEREPSYDMLILLADYFGVSLDYLLGVSDVKTPNIGTLAQNMQQRRAQLGLSYQDLADRTGMSKSTLQRYETGAIRNISLAKLAVLAEGLNTTAEQLFGRERNHFLMQNENQMFWNWLSIAGYEVEVDNCGEKVWIRNRRDSKCYLLSWSELENLQQTICRFMKFEVNEMLSSAPVIKRPTNWRRAVDVWNGE